MSIRTTVTLDEDLVERIKMESRSRGTSFRQTLNDVLRVGLHAAKVEPRPRFRVRAFHMGYRPELNYDNTESLIEYLEGPEHR
jgi:hypothetical protein